MTSTKTCTACQTEKPIGDFYIRNSRWGGYPISMCKACSTFRANQWNKTNRDRPMKRRWSRRVAVLGEPVRCEICGAGFSGVHHEGPHFDHNHGVAGGKQIGAAGARGWLCSKCNSGIGALGDNPRILRAAAEYLEKRGHAQTRPRFK